MNALTFPPPTLVKRTRSDCVFSELCLLFKKKKKKRGGGLCVLPLCKPNSSFKNNVKRFLLISGNLLFFSVEKRLLDLGFSQLFPVLFH